MLIKLQSILKDYIWGGTKIRDEWNKATNLARVAESWQISAHPDGPSTITNGDCKGQTFNAYLAQAGGGVLGSRCAGGEFPVLIKLIDAAQSLSVQLHPDDAYALRVEGERGKTEMWYVADCDPGAFLYLGFRRDVSKQEFAQAICDGTVETLLQRIDVKKGDCVFVKAKTVHAIGKGCLILEVQQSSNTTYRVYDYKRTDANGNERELHIEKALEVANLNKAEPVAQPVTRQIPGGICAELARCEYFAVTKYQSQAAIHIPVTPESFAAFVVLSGEGVARCGRESLPYKKGDSFFAEAGSGEVVFDGGEIIAVSV